MSHQTVQCTGLRYTLNSEIYLAKFSFFFTSLINCIFDNYTSIFNNQVNDFNVIGFFFLNNLCSMFFTQKQVFTPPPLFSLQYKYLFRQISAYHKVIIKGLNVTCIGRQPKQSQVVESLQNGC